MNERISMRSKVTFKDILKTIHADLIGKDSHRGITLTYGWMANQVGHFALGFIPVCILDLYFTNLLNCVLYVCGFWLLFEIYNALSPLYKKEYKGNGTFRIRWANLTFDTFTDLCFFWFGAFSFYFLASESKAFIFLYFIGFICLLVFIRYWFLTKLFQQNAYFPYPFRLSQWDAPIDLLNSKQIRTFLYEFSSPKHFLVFGQKGSGKTRLSVGIGNEFSIEHRKSTYTTFTKWLIFLDEDNETSMRSRISLWSWFQSDILIIDDIHPGIPLSSNRYKAQDVFEFVTRVNKERNLKALQESSVVWVVGTCHPEEGIKDWENMLLALGIQQSDILIIDLDKN